MIWWLIVAFLAGIVLTLIVGFIFIAHNLPRWDP